MKTFLLTLLITSASLNLFSQENGCNCGVLIGNSTYSERPLTIAYSKVFKAMCKKGRKLYLDQGTKSSIKVQFFNKLLRDYPELLEPFKNKTASAIQVWVVESDEAFIKKIERDFGTSFQSYSISEINDFNYDQNLYTNWKSEKWKNDYQKMRTYLSKY